MEEKRIDFLNNVNGLGNPKLQKPWLQIQQTAAMQVLVPSSSQTHAHEVHGHAASSSSSSYEKTTPDGESEDAEMFSDIVLKYIRDMLMDEDMEERKCMYQECSALQATVKPFYDILGENYPPCPTVDPAPPSLYDSGIDQKQFYNNSTANNKNKDGSNREDSRFGGLFDSPISKDFESPLSSNFSAGYSSQVSFSSSCSSTVIDGLPDSPINEISLRELFSENDPSFGVGKEFEDVPRFVPNENVRFGVENDRLKRGLKQESDFELKVEKKEDGALVLPRNAHSDDENGYRRQKNPHRDDLDLEDRPSNKHSAVYPENEIRTPTFDEVLLCGGKNGRTFSVIQKEVLGNGVQKSSQNGSVKGTQGVKSRGKKQGKKEVVDLRALLVHCAQAVATDDNRGAKEILNQIRQHASCYGDGSQRLAHYFAESLVARLSGTGGRLYTMLSSNRPSAAEILKAYHLYLAATPFKKMSHSLSNQTILNVAENATRLHIVDFGILYGFQWPCLIQSLAARPGGPPKLRITGIDFPQPGFRPAERIEETGRRLADYARSFKVPFEYQAIASKWENLQVEDLFLSSDEVLVVNCMYRLRNLMDETVVVDSPRNIVLNKIRIMNPRVFIQGVVNGAYNAPFFITRFREALFHYSALFDALETTVPRDHPERIVIEKELLGREILNVIACEGLERVERPETYKQWQGRTQRAGFVQLPLNQNILSKCRARVKALYHKDFGVDEDGNWMLLGWKGRIISALSTWRPSG
eukprot:Gb_29764 [translate_table: standard]